MDVHPTKNVSIGIDPYPYIDYVCLDMVDLFQPSKLLVHHGESNGGHHGYPNFCFFLTVPLVQNPIFLGVFGVRCPAKSSNTFAEV